MRPAILILVLLLVGCSSVRPFSEPLVDEAKIGFVCERVYKKEVKAPPSSSESEARRDLELPKTRMKCSGKRLFWFRVKLNT